MKIDHKNEVSTIEVKNNINRGNSNDDLINSKNKSIKDDQQIHPIIDDSSLEFL